MINARYEIRTENKKVTLAYATSWDSFNAAIRLLFGAEIPKGTSLHTIYPEDWLERRNRKETI